MRVALVVDNPLRDLPGLVLVGSHLVRAGASCLLVPMMRQELELAGLAADAVVLNYLRPTNERLARRLIDAGVQTFVLDTEGSQLGDTDLFDRTQADRSIHPGVSAFLSWGKALADHCVESGLYRADQVVVTGQPRFDFHTPALRAAALHASPYADAVPRPMVLVTGNFPLCNPQFLSPDGEIRMMMTTFGMQEDELRAWQARQQRALDEMIALVRELAAAHAAVSFVYRPHPFEGTDVYASSFRGLRNVRMIKEGGVEGWIIRSSAVIQRNSTTAIDAGMAQVPALSPRWIPSPDSNETAEQTAIGCRDATELDAHLRSAIDGTLEMPGPTREALATVIRDWFHAADGHSAKRVATAILERTEVRAGTRHREACRSIAAPAHASLRSRARQITKTLLPPEAARYLPRRGTFLRQSTKRFSVDQVNGLLGAIGESLPALGSPNVVATEARQHDEYRNPIKFGRAITLRSQA